MFKVLLRHVFCFFSATEKKGVTSKSLQQKSLLLSKDFFVKFNFKSCLYNCWQDSKQVFNSTERRCRAVKDFYKSKMKPIKVTPIKYVNWDDAWELVPGRIYLAKPSGGNFDKEFYDVFDFIAFQWHNGVFQERFKKVCHTANLITKRKIAIKHEVI